ncbi:MAG: anthrone oxygenase family protein [Taibaiella sp.]
MTTAILFQIIAILLTGLIAGLFYGYDCSIIKGLGNLPDREYLGAFKSINRVILNPYFFISFMGSMLVLPIAVWLSYKDGGTTSCYLLAAATIVYGAGVFGVTILGNVPLNNLVERFDISAASQADIQALRQKFETSWNKLHHIRTYANILSFLLTIISLVKR